MIKKLIFLALSFCVILSTGSAWSLEPPIYIGCGNATEIVDGDKVWLAGDNFATTPLADFPWFNPDQFMFDNPPPIEVYQDGYHKNNWCDPEEYDEISVPVANGSYLVRIHMFNNNDSHRLMNVTIEGVVVLKDYDPQAAAFALGAINNGVNAVVVSEFIVEVTDGDGIQIRDSIGGTGCQDAWMGAIEIHSNGTPSSASRPNPSNKSEEVLIDVGGASWKPGAFANTHNVFFGTDFNDVNEATLTERLGTTVYAYLAFDSNNINLSRLAYGTTYYWRVDEVNAPPDGTVLKGPVWSFTTEPYSYKIPAGNITVTASSSSADNDPNDTINESGLSTANKDLHSKNIKDMWLSSGEDANNVWIRYDFDKLYKLHEMLVWNYNVGIFLSAGFKDVNVEYSADGQTWLKLANVPEFEQGTGQDSYKYNTVVDFNNAVAQSVRLTVKSNWSGGIFSNAGLSEVRFMYIPVRARKPAPEDKESDVDLVTTLSWREGREADKHHLYISTDVNAVNESTASVTILDQASYILSVELGRTYYWRIDEINNIETPASWIGDIWSFSTPDYIIVDDFETGYDNADNAVYKIWKDSTELGNTSVNGSWMGRKNEPYLHTINHNGGHSAPMSFDNSSVSSSYVTAQSTELPIDTSDWSLGSPTTLTIWFRGDANGPVVADSELYCTIGGKTATYGGSVKEALQRGTWYQWDINLAALGADLSNIPDITIGIKKVGATGAVGVIYIDDIQLTGLEPQPIYPAYYVEAENYVSITTGMSIQTTTAGYTGTGYIASDPEITENQTANPPTAGIATYTFNIPETGQYRIGFRTFVKTEGTTNYNSWWVNFTGPSITGMTGWANFNEVPAGSWLWRDVWNGTGPNGITYTISQPGTYTLEVAYRERGMMLDAIEIRKIGN